MKERKETEVELNIRSASDLKKSTKPLDRLPFVRISIDGLPGSFKTKTDEEHGNNPVWNFGWKFQLPESYQLDANVNFDIRHDSRMGSKFDRSIGMVKVRIEDFVSGEEDHETSITRDVITSSGEVKGTLTLSHKHKSISQAVMDNTACGEPLADPPTKEVPNNKTKLSMGDGIRLGAVAAFAGEIVMRIVDVI